MRRSKQRRCSESRGGFTLAEIMLVLAVLAVFASMSLPSVMRMFGRQKLTAAAERVREAIASARVLAIESGLNYQFCCQPGGTQYSVIPAEQDLTGFTANNQNSGNNQGPPVPKPVQHTGHLPDGVVFGAEIVTSIANPTSPPMQGTSTTGTGNTANSSGQSGMSWSPTILFKPDGSAVADIQLTVSDTRSQTVRLKIRALTGAVSMEPLQAGKH